MITVVTFLRRHGIISHRWQWCNVALLVAWGGVMQKVPALGCAWAVCFPCGRQQGDMDVWDATVSTMLSSTQTLCIWGTGGATPGKFLLGLRVVTCDTSTLVRPNRVLVVPASSVSLSAWVIFRRNDRKQSSPHYPGEARLSMTVLRLFCRSTVRALNKNFSIAFLFPVFITLLFFQHNRTVYDVVAGTIVVQCRGDR